MAETEPGVTDFDPRSSGATKDDDDTDGIVDNSQLSQLYIQIPFAYT